MEITVKSAQREPNSLIQHIFKKDSIRRKALIIKAKKLP